MAWLAPISLVGAHASVVPLAHDQRDALIVAAQDGELWNLWYTAIPKPDGMRAEIERRLKLHAEEKMLPFAVIDASGKIVGMTTYMNVDTANRRVEIGSTWYAKSAQRSSLNTQCKRLLLAHAFDTLDCIAVEFRTSFYNTQSRRAIERLGAKQDGILRNHSLYADGSLRDTCVYSILPHEWPTVRKHLDFQLSKPRT